MASEIRNSEARLTDWGEVLGGRIDNCLPSDIDGILERNGYMLVLEAKNLTEKLSEGQARVLDAFLRTGLGSVLIVYLSGPRVRRVRGYTHWGTVIDVEADSEKLRAWVSMWIRRVSDR